MQSLTLTASVVVLVLVSAEYALHFFRRSHDYDFRDARSNLVIAAVSGVLVRLFWNSLMLLGFTWAYAATPLRLSGEEWWFWPVAILSSDLCFYLYHRTSHHVRLLWGAHSVHHSSEDLNLSTALRLSWFESSFRWVFWLPLPLAGMAPSHAIIAYFVIRFYQFGLHSKTLDLPRWLGYVFNTPSHHRVHHGRNSKYLDRNFGGCLIVWDRLLGTFEEEDEAVDYGLRKAIDSYNPITINCREYISMVRDACSEPRWRKKWRHLLRLPADPR